MRLKVRDAAELLDVSDKTIYRWITMKKIPVHRVSGQYRFNRAELLEWATSQSIPAAPAMMREPEDVIIPSLEDALRNGGVHYRVEGGDTATVLRNVVDILSLPEEVDREYLYQVLMARESVGSTAIGGGIAIPHVRNPVTLNVPRAIVGLCFLEKSIDFEAIDGNPVHTLFTIVSPTIKAHLNLLSKLAYGLRSSSFAKAVARKGSRDKILSEAGKLDSQLSKVSSQRKTPPLCR